MDIPRPRWPGALFLRPVSSYSNERSHEDKDVLGNVIDVLE